MSINTNKKQIRELTYLAIFTAIVIVLQLLAVFMAKLLPFSLSFVLVPIVIAVAICGFKAGPWLGFVFGIIVLITDESAHAFFLFNPAATVFLVLLKGVMAGVCAALVYRALEKNHKYFAVTLSAIIAPIVNTGIFFVGGLVFFREWFVPGESNLGIVAITIIGIIAINFIVELAVNLVLVPTVYRLIEIYKKRK